MRVAIFAEGRSDQAVLTNILKGALNIDRSDIRFNLPEYEFDQTDLHTMDEAAFSNWTLVRTECLEKKELRIFLDEFEGNRFAVIQIDSAERHLQDYEVLEPIKGRMEDREYSESLVLNVIAKLKSWLDDERFHDKTAFAVTVEEIEAWLLTLHEPNLRRDTCQRNDPKGHLNTVLNRVLASKERNVLRQEAFEKYLALSYDFRKPKKLAAAAKNNRSLEMFCESLEAFRGNDEVI